MIANLARSQINEADEKERGQQIGQPILPMQPEAHLGIRANEQEWTRKLRRSGWLPFSIRYWTEQRFNFNHGKQDAFTRANRTKPDKTEQN